MMRDCGPVTCADAHNAERNVGLVVFLMGLMPENGLSKAVPFSVESTS